MATIIGHTDHLRVATVCNTTLRKVDGSGGLDERAVVDGADAIACRGHGIDAPLVVERQFVYAHLAVNARAILQVVFVDAI